MKKKHSVAVKPGARALAAHEEAFHPLATAELQAVAGGGRLRVPVGYTSTGDPIYADEASSADPMVQGEEARIWRPSG